MPGPRNSKKQKKLQAKKEKKKTPPKTDTSSQSYVLPPPPGLTPPSHTSNDSTLESEDSLIAKLYNSTSIPTLPYPVSTHPSTPIHHTNDNFDDSDENDDIPNPLLPKEPYIHDPGNGPRVKDMNSFLSSPFAAGPSLDDPLCAEFASEDLIDMLCQVLPEETALILWYNKSRLTARVCPACQRLYRLGDVLPDHLPAGEDGSPPPIAKPTSPYLYKEQEISGICSPICFVLAAFNYPSAITSTFGRMAEDLSDETWDLLDALPNSGKDAPHDLSLGMLLKMSRCHDLGLGKLLFPDSDSDVDFEELPDDHELGRSYEDRNHAYDRDDLPDSDSDYGSDASVCGSDCSCQLSKGKYASHSEEEVEEERGRRRTRG